VKTQIWIVVLISLVAIVRKRLSLAASLSRALQILSVTLFEKTPIYALFRLPTQTQNSPKTLTNWVSSTFSRTVVSVGQSSFRCFDDAAEGRRESCSHFMSTRACTYVSTESPPA
jgi:hypothetical protein